MKVIFPKLVLQEGHQQSWKMNNFCFSFNGNLECGSTACEALCFRGDYLGHFNYCNCTAIGHMDIAILLWWCRYYCNSIAIVFGNVCIYLKKNLRSSSQYRYWGTQWMAWPYCWFKNQNAKNARYMYSRRIVLGFFFTFIWVEKGVFIFQQVKMLEV